MGQQVVSRREAIIQRAIATYLERWLYPRQRQLRLRLEHLHVRAKRGEQINPTEPGAIRQEIAATRNDIWYADAYPQAIYPNVVADALAAYLYTLGERIQIAEARHYWTLKQYIHFSFVEPILAPDAWKAHRQATIEWFRLMNERAITRSLAEEICPAPAPSGQHAA